MRKLDSNPNVDNSDLINYLHGRIKDNSGVGDGTAVNERVYGDLHQMKEKLMILAGIVANNLPDNETNGYQLIDALIDLASKNDYIQDLTTLSSVLQIPVKVSLMKTGESLICLASADKTSETTIKGSDNSITNVTFLGNFKANEYVRFIKTASGVTLVRIGDNSSLNAMVSELFFLKKANYAQELAGILDTVATTPQTNALVFVERVNGPSSSVSLANASRNGLLSKEFWSIINGIGSNPVKNIGGFEGFNVGDSGVLTPFGNVTSASAVGPNPDGFVTVNLQNPMTNTNYFVRIHIQSQNSNINQDNDVCCPVFKPISTTQVLIAFREVSSVNQLLRVHLEVVQL